MPYATRADIEMIFGKDNVRTWADLDNEEIEEVITGRIEWALQDASDQIDTELRGLGYVVPLDPAPTGLVTQCARLAGVLLYEGRGLMDLDQNTGRPIHKLEGHRRQVMDWLMRIRLGVLNLTTGRNISSSPGVVKDTPTQVYNPYGLYRIN